MNNLYRELAPISDSAWASIEEEARRTFGTYYIGYAADVGVTERMLDNMFIGDPPGNYDRILDFSTAATGTLFFAPSADFLDDLPEPPPAPSAPAAADAADGATELAGPAQPGTPASSSGSLGIGSLKGSTPQ